MAITLARICANAEKTYGMKLIAGRAGMDNFVRWVHIVEDSEVPDFMHGNELVFTTGIGHKGSGWLLDFVRQLKGKNAAGVVVNIGPYINAVPKDVMEYCECNALPLFVVPWSVRLIDHGTTNSGSALHLEYSMTSFGAAFMYGPMFHDYARRRSCP